MPTYIALLQFTQQGIQGIKGGPARLDEARTAYKSAGANLREFYLVMGEYDAVVIADAPSDDVMAKLALMTGARGNVRTVTMRAFAEADYRKLVQSLPS